MIHLPEGPDHRNCRNLKRGMDLLLAENYIDRIIFDLTHILFMDLSGIGVFLNRYKQMTASRRTVAYYGTGPQVGRILEMGEVSRLIERYKDRESAVKG